MLLFFVFLLLVLTLITTFTAESTFSWKIQFNSWISGKVAARRGSAHRRSNRKFSCCCHTGRKWLLLRLFFNEDTDISISFCFLASGQLSTAMQRRRQVEAVCWDWRRCVWLCLRRRRTVSVALTSSFPHSERLATLALTVRHPRACCCSASLWTELTVARVSFAPNAQLSWIWNHFCVCFA